MCELQREIVERAHAFIFNDISAQWTQTALVEIWTQFTDYIFHADNHCYFKQFKRLSEI